jgi:hypothetical protein
MSKDELTSVELNPETVFDLIFQKDQIFSDLKVQDFVLISYNSGEIFNLSLVLDLDFNIGLV